MINFRWLGFLLLAAAAPLSVYSEAEPVPAPQPLLGYGAQASAEQQAWERKFRAGISPQSAAAAFGAAWTGGAAGVARGARDHVPHRPRPGRGALENEFQLGHNEELLQISRLFLSRNGLPERPWFKNQIYAPGAYTGYGAKPIAAVREYMDEKKWAEADAQVPQVSEIIESAAAGIDKAAADFERGLAGSHRP
jgi:hypothetical protein